MSAGKDSGQYVLTDAGELIIEPRTWDGEPLYSVSTVREGLFDPSAFQQLAGQLALEADDETR